MRRLFNEVNRKYTRRIKAVGIPLIIIEVYASVYAREPFTSTVLSRFATDVVLLVVMWHMVAYFIMLFRNVFPSVKHFFWRSLLSVVCGVIACFALHFLIIEVMINGVRELRLTNVPYHLFFFTTTVVVVYEVVLNFVQLSQAEKEREQLVKSNLKSQLSSLKSQVNPHFLFNSLNTLLSLIPASPKKAEQFVEDLARVYRYLLQANEKVVTTLDKELAFATHYFQLLKTRYTKSISLDIQVDASYYEYYIPSLTLQLLIENAVKHNIISNSKPLHIDIYITGKDHPLLNVRNNLQQKVLNIPSTKLGLSNIMTKFNLMNRDIEVVSENGYFLVSLPLFEEVPEHVEISR